jgi:hypothetical protein
MSYVTIATVCPRTGHPWNTPVVGFFDDTLNLYWASWTQNQHSRNIAAQPYIFAVIYDSSTPLGEGEGLYLQMVARELTDETEVIAAKTVYTDRCGEDGSHTAFMGACPRRIYKACLYKVWHNTEGARGRHFVDVRQPLA